MPDKLNLGCGTDIKLGYINLDIAAMTGVDIVHDINVLPLPFNNECFSEILCRDVLEHLDYQNLVQDLHRVLKPGGKLVIRVPHYTSRNNHVDPTHKKTFSHRTFEFFVKSSGFGRQYYFKFPGFAKIIRANILFEKKWLLYNYLLEPIINIHPKIKSLYEATFLCYLFPAENIIVELQK